MGLERKMAVFVSSCDRRRDVFKVVAASFNVFWKDCPFSKYVGLNSPLNGDAEGFLQVYAPEKGWREELLTQLCQLKEEYVLLFLDDFFICKPVNTTRVCYFLSLVDKMGLDYLRLIEIERSFLVRFSAGVISRLCGFEVVQIPFRAPYYSSLQVAIWRRNHLVRMLESYAGETIWDFEHHRIHGSKHFAIVGPSPIYYKHLVERGKWLPEARSELKRIGVVLESKEREFLPAWYGWVRLGRKTLFQIIGYTGMRLRRIIGQVAEYK